MPQPIFSQVPEVDFPAYMQTLAHGQDACWILQQVINGGSQPQQIKVTRMLQGIHQLTHIQLRGVDPIRLELVATTYPVMPVGNRFVGCVVIDQRREL